jgi:NitT/TauT family transport system ATP-binding protein
VTAVDTVSRGPGARESRPPVRLEHLSKRFGSADAPLVLDDISLEVPAGQFVCLLGASGCGKSTVLNILAGLETPTVGSVSVPGGQPSLMFQDHGLFPWLTTGENVAFPLKLRGVGKDERAAEVERLLKLVRLTGKADTRVHELSGGMRQRVALARAIAQGSSVLLMDEPFAALDAITRDVLHEELERLWRELALTVIFVTHNVREAVRLGERVVLLSSRPGRIAQEWQIDISGERRIEAPDVSRLSTEITQRLRQEISRHGH